MQAGLTNLIETVKATRKSRPILYLQLQIWTGIAMGVATLAWVWL